MKFECEGCGEVFESYGKLLEHRLECERYLKLWERVAGRNPERTKQEIKRTLERWKEVHEG